MDRRQRLEDMVRLRYDPLDGMGNEITELKDYAIITAQDMVDFTVKLLDIYNRAIRRISYDLETANKSADDYIAQMSSPALEFDRGDSRYRKYPHYVFQVTKRKEALVFEAELKKAEVIRRFGEELNSKNIEIRTEDKALYFHLDGKHYRFKFEEPLEGIEQLVPRGILPFKRNKKPNNDEPIYLQSSINFL